MGEHVNCESVARARADQTGLDLDISPFPFAVGYPEFPARQFVCPHGAPYWVQPTAEEAARLRALNASPEGGAADA